MSVKTLLKQQPFLMGKSLAGNVASHLIPGRKVFEGDVKQSRTQRAL